MVEQFVVMRIVLEQQQDRMGEEKKKYGAPNGTRSKRVTSA